MEIYDSGILDVRVREGNHVEEKPNVMTLQKVFLFSSDVCWHPTNSYLTSSCDYDGSIIIYDIRSSFPLHVKKAVHQGKAFCLTWKDSDIILSGGEDKKLKRLNTRRNVL